MEQILNLINTTVCDHGLSKPTKNDALTKKMGERLVEFLLELQQNKAVPEDCSSKAGVSLPKTKRKRTYPAPAEKKQQNPCLVKEGCALDTNAVSPARAPTASQKFEMLLRETRTSARTKNKRLFSAPLDCKLISDIDNGENIVYSPSLRTRKERASIMGSRKSCRLEKTPLKVTYGEGLHPVTRKRKSLFEDAQEKISSVRTEVCAPTIVNEEGEEELKHNACTGSPRVSKWQTSRAGVRKSSRFEQVPLEIPCDERMQSRTRKRKFLFEENPSLQSSWEKRAESPALPVAISGACASSIVEEDDEKELLFNANGSEVSHDLEEKNIRSETEFVHTAKEEGAEEFSPSSVLGEPAESFRGFDNGNTGELFYGFDDNVAKPEIVCAQFPTAAVPDTEKPSVEDTAVTRSSEIISIGKESIYRGEIFPENGCSEKEGTESLVVSDDFVPNTEPNEDSKKREQSDSWSELKMDELSDVNFATDAVTRRNSLEENSPSRSTINKSFLTLPGIKEDNTAEDRLPLKERFSEENTAEDRLPFRNRFSGENSKVVVFSNDVACLDSSMPEGPVDPELSSPKSGVLKILKPINVTSVSRSPATEQASEKVIYRSPLIDAFNTEEQILVVGNNENALKKSTLFTKAALKAAEFPLKSVPQSFSGTAAVEVNCRDNNDAKTSSVADESAHLPITAHNQIPLCTKKYSFDNVVKQSSPPGDSVFNTPKNSSDYEVKHDAPLVISARGASISAGTSVILLKPSEGGSHTSWQNIQELTVKIVANNEQSENRNPTVLPISVSFSSCEKTFKLRPDGGTLCVTFLDMNSSNEGASAMKINQCCDHCPIKNKGKFSLNATELDNISVLCNASPIKKTKYGVFHLESQLQGKAEHEPQRKELSLACISSANVSGDETNESEKEKSVNNSDFERNEDGNKSPCSIDLDDSPASLSEEGEQKYKEKVFQYSLAPKLQADEAGEARKEELRSEFFAVDDEKDMFIPPTPSQSSCPIIATLFTTSKESILVDFTETFGVPVAEKFTAMAKIVVIGDKEPDVTSKVLFGLANLCTFLSYEWVEESLRTGIIAAEEPYIVRDKSFGNKREYRTLFEDFVFSVVGRCLIPADELEILLDVCGAKLHKLVEFDGLQTFKLKMILAFEPKEIHFLERKELANKCQAPVVSFEFIVKSLLNGQVELLTDYVCSSLQPEAHLAAMGYPSNLVMFVDESESSDGL